MDRKPVTKILLIEDNPGDARLIRLLLSESSTSPFDAQWVDTLQKGLDRVRAKGIDLILLDLGLPDSQGLDTFLKLQERAGSIPIVVLSGLADEELAIEAVRNGAQDYLVKGQDDKLLARAIRYAIERRRLEEERKATIAELERRNEELQHFAFVASHDLNEPLRKIQAFGDLLRNKLGTSVDAECLDYLQRMQKASKRMQELLEGLLNYSRVSTRGQPFAPADLTQVARDAASDLELRIQQTQGHVEIEELATIEVDASQVRQLLLNLIGNALKFHREEKPHIRIHGEFTSTDEEQNDGPCGNACYRIYVEDNGIGFENQYAERIFQPFQRLHGRSEYEGTGMGLAICRKIAERHGGTIRARSIPEHGSTFIVTLPAKHEA